MLWLPIRVLKWLLPNFLPYTVSLNDETQINELSLELLLLQVILPALLEQSHTRVWLKGLVRNWCRAVSWLLNIHSYLLGDAEVKPAVPVDNGAGGDGQNRRNGARRADQNLPEPAAGLGAVHQALHMLEPPTGTENFFATNL